MSRRAPAGWLGVALLVLSLSPPTTAAVEVHIEGVDEEAEKNIRGFLEITRLPGDEATAADRARRLHRKAPEQIRRALEPLGYYSPEIASRLEGGPDDWVATYEVEPGEPVRLRSVDVELFGEGREDGAFVRAAGRVPLAEDERAHHGRYEQAKRELLAVAARRGYLEADWRASRLEIDPAAGEARAILHLDTGPRYRFGDVTFNQDILDEDFLRRYLPFEEGDAFDRRQLLDLQFALSDSEYFSMVEVVSERDAARDRRIPVTVETEPRLPNRYTWGIGWGTDTGARTRFRWERRRVNRRGHRFSTEVELAETRRRLGLAYTIPLERPASERFIASADFTREELGDGLSRRNELAGRRIRLWSRWQLTEAVVFERSRDTISGTSESRQIIVPGLSLERRWRDDAIYPARAHRFDISLKGASRELASDVNFTQLRLGAHWVRRILPRTRLLTRAEWGGTAVSDVDRLPLSQRFFTGGDTSVRGFAFQSLGPRNEDGDAVGGRYLTTGSIELERLIVGDWGAAVFADAGNVSNDRRMSLEHAAGVGVRWRSPVGMLRVDVAQPISTDDGPRLHLSLGIDL